MYLLHPYPLSIVGALTCTFIRGGAQFVLHDGFTMSIREAPFWVRSRRRVRIRITVWARVTVRIRTRVRTRARTRTRTTTRNKGGWISSRCHARLGLVLGLGLALELGSGF